MKIDKDDNKYIYVIVGKNIKRIRKSKGLTQVQLADLVKYNEERSLILKTTVIRLLVLNLSMLYLKNLKFLSKNSLKILINNLS